MEATDTDNGDYVNCGTRVALDRAHIAPVMRTEYPPQNASPSPLPPSKTYHRPPQQDALLSTAYPQCATVPKSFYPQVVTHLSTKSAVTNNPQPPPPRRRRRLPNPSSVDCFAVRQHPDRDPSDPEHRAAQREVCARSTAAAWPIAHPRSAAPVGLPDLRETTARPLSSPTIGEPRAFWQFRA